MMNLGEIRFVSRQKNNAMTRFVITRNTGFQLPEPEPGVTKTDEKAPFAIQEVFRLLWNDETRNALIVNDILSAFSEGREILVLSERLEHLNMLESALANEVKYLFTLKGGMGKKQLRKIMEEIEAVPEGANRVILATGKYLGEGFDLPCLDTLFLVFPVSWRGTLTQYTGRLNREFESKSEIRIYDYVDERVPVLRRMFNRRLKAYQALGFEVK
jgi:superfamily II DNA or RNA helicase